MQEKDKAFCLLRLYVSLLTSRVLLIFAYHFYFCLAGLCWLFVFLNATMTQIRKRQVAIQAAGFYLTLLMQSAMNC